MTGTQFLGIAVFIIVAACLLDVRYCRESEKQMQKEVRELENRLIQADKVLHSCAVLYKRLSQTLVMENVLSDEILPDEWLDELKRDDPPEVDA